VINGFEQALLMGEKNPCAASSGINMVCLADHPKQLGELMGGPDPERSQQVVQAI